MQVLLGVIRTKAEPNADGFAISGEKIISAGERHGQHRPYLLARLPDPKGRKAFRYSSYPKFNVRVPERMQYVVVQSNTKWGSMAQLA